MTDTSTPANGAKFEIKAFEKVGENWMKICATNSDGRILLIHLSLDLSDRLDNPSNPKVITLSADEVFDKQNLKGSFFDSLWVRNKK